MKGKIADSIIIKVGHGIMEIPRKPTHSHENEISYDKIQSNEPERNSERTSQDDPHPTTSDQSPDVD